MRLIMAALATSAILGGTVAPANAQSITISLSDGYVSIGTPEKATTKTRRYVPRQMEHLADKLPVGSDVWWQQMDRERRGGRR